jgi:hypothetical protein
MLKITKSATAAVYALSFQDGGLLATGGPDLLLHEDAGEEGAESLAVTQHALQPADQAQREDLVRHHVTVRHLHLGDNNKEKSERFQRQL